MTRNKAAKTLQVVMNLSSNSLPFSIHFHVFAICVTVLDINALTLLKPFQHWCPHPAIHLARNSLKCYASVGRVRERTDPWKKHTSSDPLPTWLYDTSLPQTQAHT